MVDIGFLVLRYTSIFLGYVDIAFFEPITSVGRLCFVHSLTIHVGVWMGSYHLFTAHNGNRGSFCEPNNASQVCYGGYRY